MNVGHISQYCRWEIIIIIVIIKKFRNFEHQAENKWSKCFFVRSFFFSFFAQLQCFVSRLKSREITKNPGGSSRRHNVIFLETLSLFTSVQVDRITFKASSASFSTINPKLVPLFGRTIVHSICIENRSKYYIFSVDLLEEKNYINYIKKSVKAKGKKFFKLN